MRFPEKLFGMTLTIIGLITVLSAIGASAATFTVTNTNDSGAGSLRQGVLDANAATGDDVIAFDSSFNEPRTITLATLDYNYRQRQFDNYRTWRESIADFRQ